LSSPETNPVWISQEEHTAELWLVALQLAQVASDR